MRFKLWAMLKNLLTFWVVNLYIWTALTIAIVFVCLPLAMLMLKGEFVFWPSWHEGLQYIKIGLWAAFSSGTILWIKEEFFPNK